MNVQEWSVFIDLLISENFEIVGFTEDSILIAKSKILGFC